jgi:hypothetical protein
MNSNLTHLLRTGVGVDSIAHLHEIQSSRRKMHDVSQAFLTTRYTPKRANDLLNGGSVYWIINRQICARQAITDIQTLHDDNGKAFCMISMDTDIIMTSPIAHRHIQGWRYLPTEKAPQDLRIFDPTAQEDLDDIDPQMEKELREIGLL